MAETSPTAPVQGARSSASIETGRTIGLFAATCIGVGAIVGGGILALAGVALAVTGPGALLAFGLNGIIAIMTALSFAELSSAFPQSGGTYVFAKRVLTVGPAFIVGWVVWFASIVAAALYALGFATFFTTGLSAGLDAGGIAGPTWLGSTGFTSVLAALTMTASAIVIARSTGGSGNAISVAKVIVFGVLIGGGVWAWVITDPPASARMTPFLPAGPGALFQAMGYTFIALQGFDLVAAVAGEVRDPRRTLPRAMLISLVIALLVYLPLLTIVTVLGPADGSSIQDMARAAPDTIIAEAARSYLGEKGFWLVVSAGVLSMLSALLANVYAASRIAQAMARDRTLPAVVDSIHPQRGTPVFAVAVTAGIGLFIIALVHDVAAAGAASSLIFLISFALVQILCVVARRRRPRHGGFRAPFFPWLPISGALLCAALAAYQSVVVPTAGLVVVGWLAIGAGCYIWFFGHRARVQDAVHEAQDSDLLELRGRSPLVLVPTAHPDSAGLLSLMAACIAPPRVGRVLMLNVVPPMNTLSPEDFTQRLDDSAKILRDSLEAALGAGARTEALATVGLDPWDEIARVARVHHCATLLLGMSELSDAALRGRLERLASELSCNFVLFRFPPVWHPELVRRVLVPVRGNAVHNALRARLLVRLRYRAASALEVVYLVVLPATTSDSDRARVDRSYRRQLRDESTTPSSIRTVLADDVSAAITEATHECDLLILGLSRLDRSRRVFSEMTRKVVASTSCAALVISESG
ncbi:MAG: amino acid permease [bacterium]|nr:amino acid permease [bacterium]